MSKRTSIFRKSALERLASPEQLDQAIEVSRPESWLVVLIFGLLLSLALAWGVWGEIPVKVHGEGILLKGGGVMIVRTLEPGRLVEMKVATGTVVTQNQVVAVVDHPDLAQKISQAREQLEERKKELAQEQRLQERDTPQQLDLFALRKANLEKEIQDMETQIVWITEKIANQEKLVAQGLITKQTLLNTLQQSATIRNQIERARGDLKDIANQTITLPLLREQTLQAAQARANDASRLLQEMVSKDEQHGLVRSPFAGRVVEVPMNPGDQLASGAALLSLEDDTLPLKAFLFIPTADGKKITVGMAAQIVPSLYRKVEYGFIHGEVARVGDYPMTRQAMMSILENEQLTEKMSSKGAPILLEAELRATTNAPSGYAWSSSEGPPGEIFPGTVCAGEVVVRRQRPITLVMPALKDWLGL